MSQAAKRQQELKDPMLRDDLAAARAVLKKHSMMLLTASKVFKIKFLQKKNSWYNKFCKLMSWVFCKPSPGFRWVRTFDPVPDLMSFDDFTFMSLFLSIWSLCQLQILAMEKNPYFKLCVIILWHIISHNILISHNIEKKENINHHHNQDYRKNNNNECTIDDLICTLIFMPESLENFECIKVKKGKTSRMYFVFSKVQIMFQSSENTWTLALHLLKFMLVLGFIRNYLL